MSYEPANFPPEPNWWLAGVAVLFLAQVAVYVGLIVRIWMN